MNDTYQTEKDFGMAWSVVSILVAISLGCGVIGYIEDSALLDYKIECSLQELEKNIFVGQKDTKTLDAAVNNGCIQSMVLR